MTSSRIRLITEIIAALFILLFTYTAISKFMAFDGFKLALYKSPVIENNSRIVAWLLPVAELIVAFLLFFPASRKAGLYSSLALMLLFTGYLAYMLLFTKDLPCSCGGVIQKMSWGQHLLFNIFFTLLAGWASWLAGRESRNLLRDNRLEAEKPVKTSRRILNL